MGDGDGFLLCQVVFFLEAHRKLRTSSEKIISLREPKLKGQKFGSKLLFGGKISDL